MSERGEAFNVARETDFLESQFRNEEFRQARPFLNFSGEALGGVASGAGVARAADPLLKGLSPLARLTGVGAGEGAVFGAGFAQPGDRAVGALQGGLIGGVGTPFVAGLATAGGRLLGAAGNRLRDRLLSTPRDRAVRMVKEALDADDITVKEADLLIKEFGRNATIADLGDATGRLGRVATTESGAAASSTKRFLDARQRIQNIELRQTARKAAGRTSFDKGVVDAVNNAESAAEPIYREVYSEVLDVNDVMLSLLKRPSMVKAQSQAKVKLKNEGFSDEIVDDVTDVRYMDAVKRSLQDMEGKALRSGKFDEARVLGNLRREFVSEIDAQVPRYAEARNIFAGEAAMRDAAEFGRGVLVGRKFGPDEITARFTDMTDSEKQAARMGFLDWMDEEIANTGVNRATIANKFETVPKFRQAIQELFPNQAAVTDFLNTAGAQAQFSRTRNLVSGGSPTARIQADRAAQEASTLGAATEAVLNPASAVGSVLRTIKGNTKLTPEVVDEIASILFNPKIIPSEALVEGPSRFLTLPQIRASALAGGSGGFVGSQVGPEDSLAKLAREAGIIGALTQQ